MPEQFLWAGEPLNWLKQNLMKDGKRRTYAVLADFASKKFQRQITTDSVRNACRRYVFSGEDEPQKIESSQLGGVILKVVAKGPITLSGLSESVDRSEKTVRDEIEKLRTQGYQIPEVLEDYSPVMLFKEPIPKRESHCHMFKGRVFRFGHISDTHGGSSLAKIDELHAAYDLFEQEEIPIIYHTGDIFDGVGMYRGHEFEVDSVGADKQHKFVAQNYPQRKNIVTYLIGGNHDYSYTRRSGLDLCARIGPGYGEEVPPRPDIVYLGPTERDILINDSVKIRLFHPSGGAAYALSYHLQKTIESYPGGTKPQILLVGHFHTSFWLDYRNIFAAVGGCFQGQTLYLKEKHLMPAVGFWIWTITTHDDGTIIRAVPEWFKFYEGKIAA